MRLVGNIVRIACQVAHVLDALSMAITGTRPSMSFTTQTRGRNTPQSHLIHAAEKHTFARRRDRSGTATITRCARASMRPSSVSYSTLSRAGTIFAVGTPRWAINRGGLRAGNRRVTFQSQTIHESRAASSAAFNLRLSSRGMKVWARIAYGRPAVRRARFTRTRYGRSSKRAFKPSRCWRCARRRPSTLSVLRRYRLFVRAVVGRASSDDESWPQIGDSPDAGGQAPDGHRM